MSFVVAIQNALAEAGMATSQIGHVNADGMGTIDDDQAGGHRNREVLGNVPVTALKGNFGNLGGRGLVELAASLLGLRNGVVPPTRNYHTPDPRQMSRSDVVRETGRWRAQGLPCALVLNQSPWGTRSAVISLNRKVRLRRIPW